MRRWQFLLAATMSRMLRAFHGDWLLSWFFCYSWPSYTGTNFIGDVLLSNRTWSCFTMSMHPKCPGPIPHSFCYHFMKGGRALNPILSSVNRCDPSTVNCFCLISILILINKLQNLVLVVLKSRSKKLQIVLSCWFFLPGVDPVSFVPISPSLFSAVEAVKCC